jgi:hypothetical protein
MEVRGLVERDPAHLLTVYDPGRPKQRLGKPSDGGYVIAAGLDYDFLISCGISDEFGFDAAFVAQHGVAGAAFDGTVDRPAAFPAQIEFCKRNIGVGAAEENLFAMLGAHKKVFLKMDIEGGEWAWLNAVPEALLANAQQIAIELHGLWDDSWLASRAEKIAAVGKLTRTHRVVHAHANNCSAFAPPAAPGVAGVPSVVELTLLRADLCGAALNTAPLPVPCLDFDNNPFRPRIDLRGWPFVHPVHTTPLRPHICRRVLQAWDSLALPPAVAQARQDMMALNPTYEFELFDSATVERFFREEFPELLPFWRQAGDARADLWRYAVLYKRGGVYLDADCVLRVPLDSLIEPADDMVVTRGGAGLFCQRMLVARAQHPLLRSLLNLCAANIARRSAGAAPDSASACAGPALLTELLQHLWGDVYNFPDSVFVGQDSGAYFSIRTDSVNWQH